MKRANIPFGYFTDQSYLFITSLFTFFRNSRSCAIYMILEMNYFEMGMQYRNNRRLNKALKDGVSVKEMQ